MKKTYPSSLALKKFNFKTYEKSQTKNTVKTADVKLEEIMRGKQHLALKMIKDGLSEKFIIQYTGLTAGQIQALKARSQ